MKQSLKTRIIWLLAVALIAATHPASAFGPQVERSLELNGISDTFGNKDAFFILTQPDVWAAPRSFILTVGKSQYGIKLLAVDITSSHVQIERDGLKQSLRLRSIMDLPPSAISGVAGNPVKLSTRGEDDLSGNIDSNNSLDDRLAGNPGYGSLPAISSKSPDPVKNPTPDPASTPGSKSSNSNGSNDVDPAIALQDQSQTEWYQQSLNIEQQRIETAQAVLAGEMTPWPRTPLTPPGTASVLVDPKAFYSGHIPGYRQPPSF